MKGERGEFRDVFIKNIDGILIPFNFDEAEFAREIRRMGSMGL